MPSKAAPRPAKAGPVCGSPGDRPISGRECTATDETPCAVKVSFGFAAPSAERQGLPNAARLEALRQRLGRDETVCLSEARTELQAWVAGTLTNRNATGHDKEWARSVSEALRLRA